jgi:hypothetical protein
VYLRHGFDECLLKPVSLGQFRRLLIRWGLVASPEEDIVQQNSDEKSAIPGEPALDRAAIIEMMGAFNADAADMLRMFAQMTQDLVARLATAAQADNLHDLAEARRLADRVVIVDAGQTLQTGAPASVFASPRNARVAELVGIQNHFQGRFFKDQLGWARLRWTDASRPECHVDLPVVDKNKIDDDTPVTWVMNGEEVDVLADRDLPSLQEPGHTRLRCQLMEVLSLGEISLCTLRPEALPSQTITLNLTSRLLQRLQVGSGGWVQLLISPAALHIMPVRTA